MKSTVKLVLRAAATVFLALSLASLVAGQQTGPRSAAAGGNGTIRNDTTRLERERRESEFNLRMLEKEANTPTHRQAAQLAFAQIADDFLHIQIVNNKLMQSVISDGALDLAFVAKSASEIKKLAGRLKDNMVLPEPEKGAKRSQAEVGPGAKQLRTSLSALGEMIAGFVENPIFKKANVVDVQLSTKARCDLEQIIDLSNQVRKSSEKLSKAGEKSQ